MSIQSTFDAWKISRSIFICFLVIATLHAEEVEGDDEVIENLEFLQLMEVMESEISLDEIEGLDSVEGVGLLGEIQ